jgi:hypothetical protein
MVVREMVASVWDFPVTGSRCWKGKKALVVGVRRQAAAWASMPAFWAATSLSLV